jgi:hypothetical protein
MADYTVPFAPTSYQPVARYTNPYVGSLLELMQQQSRAQADADTRRMQLAGQLWQNLAQAGSQTVQAMAEAPERRRQQQLAQMQFDQAVRQRDIQTAVDNIPTDASQWTTYLGGLKPFQAHAVQATMLQLQEAAKQRQNATADARGMAAAAELSSNAPSLNRFNAGEVRAGRMTPADAQAQATALSTLSALPAGEAFAKGGIAPARGFDQDAFTRSRLGGVVMQSPTIQAEMVKTQLAALGKRFEPQKASQGETVNMPAVTAFGVPAATIEGGTKTPTAEETMLAAYRASLGLAPGATMTSEQLAGYPKWKAEQGQSSAPPSDLARALARYAASKGKRIEDVTYDEELQVRKNLAAVDDNPVLQQIRQLQVGQLQRNQQAMTPAQATMAGRLADDYTQQSKDYLTRLQARDAIRTAATNPSAAGDLALIFAFMRMLDPGSTVREGEFANAQNAAGVPDTIRNAYNRAMTGERLNPAQRADFMAQAESQFASAQRRQRGLVNVFTGRAKRAGLNPEDVVIDYDTVFAPATPAGVSDDELERILHGKPKP